ncbi:MAG TPA: AI-2E family transporter [Kofleriaceae bacterium]|jgi:predicted PurR-regulated permease PerM|nr:AI-2E family transporter [Kofleriaceae bacterium]
MRTLAILVCIVILLAAVKAASSIIVPLLLATLIALAFQPLADRLSRRGLPPIVAAIVTILCVLAAIGAVALVIGLAARDFAAAAPGYADDLESLHARVQAWFDRRGWGQAFRDVDVGDSGLSVGGVLRVGAVALSGVLGDLTQVLFLTAFIQLETTLLRNKLELILAGTTSYQHVGKAIDETQRYLRVKAMLSLANGILLGLWCWLWGVSNPLLWGVLAFALNWVPIIGSLIAAIPPVVLGLVEVGIGGALGVTAGYIAVNLMVDNMLEPRLMGRAVGLSPLVLMVSLLLWGYVLGPVGGLVSVPLTVVVRIFFDYHPSLRWVGLLMSARVTDYKDLIERARPPVAAD